MLNAVCARPDGSFEIMEGLYMLGCLGNRIVEPELTELTLLPEGATLTMLPTRALIALNEDSEICDFTLDEEGNEICAMAALLPQGFTRTLLPAVLDRGEPLPLLGYAAVGAIDGDLYVAAVQTDEHYKWHPENYNTPELADLVEKKLLELPDNAIVKNLAHCALEYGCFTAQNIFYNRFEGGVPVSPVCNADCVGCISLQPAECCPSPQERIKETPSKQDVVDLIFSHITNAPDCIASFGQGCEGEPSLQGDLIATSIREVRAKTHLGTINMNTNAGSLPDIKKIVDAGIDSLRVSMISAIAETYETYHRPKNYHFADVRQGIAYAREHGVWVSLNLLLYPGLNDREEEIVALCELVAEFGINQIQMRNLNIDPMEMNRLYGDYLENGLGVPSLIETLKMNFPELVLGNYSRPKYTVH